MLADDMRKTSDLVKETLDMDFQDIGVFPEWKFALSANEGRRVARAAADAGEPIDVAIVDLYLGDSKDQDGAAVMREVRKSNDKAYIVLVTALPDLDPGFRERFRPLADRVLTFAEIGESSNCRWSDIASDVKQHLVEVGRIEVGRVTYEPPDVGIMSVLEYVGQRTARDGGCEEGARALRSLGLKCLRGSVSEAADVNIGFLAPGRSGASVCRLDVSGGGESSQAFVLKFGFDRGALEHELAMSRAAAKVLEQTSLMATVGDLQSDERGFHAIAAKVASRAIPLRRWLRSDPSIDRARDMAEVILLEQLEPFYRRDGRSDAAAEEWLTLSPGQGLRTLAAVDRYGPALGDDRAGKLARASDVIDRVLSFVRADFTAIRLGSLDRKVIYVRAFGDLHAENILVQPSVSPRPVLIDASHYGGGHWSSDNARLLVDLLLRTRDSDVEAMLWPAVPILEAQLPSLCSTCDPAIALDTWRDEPADAFMARAVELLQESTHRAELGVSLEDWHLEWHLGLAREFLRQCSHEDLTPPRACLAIASAAEHLRLAADCASASGLA